MKLTISKKNRLDLVLGVKNGRYNLNRSYTQSGYIRGRLKNAERDDSECDTCGHIIKQDDKMHLIYSEKRITPKYFVCEDCFNILSSK